MFKKHKKIETKEEGEALVEGLTHLENTISYDKLFYTSGDKENFNFYKSGSLVDMYQRLAL